MGWLTLLSNRMVWLLSCNALRWHLQCFAMALAMLCDGTCNALRWHLQCFAVALAMLCGGTCNALREIIHVILKNDIVFHGDDNYKIVYIKKALQSRKTTGKHPMWALTDSNRRPSACKADALNQLS